MMETNPTVGKDLRKGFACYLKHSQLFNRTGDKIRRNQDELVQMLRMINIHNI